MKLEAALGGRKHLEGSIPEKRAQFNGLAGALQQLWPPVEGLTVEGVSAVVLFLSSFKPTTPCSRSRLTPAIAAGIN